MTKGKKSSKAIKRVSISLDGEQLQLLGSVRGFGDKAAEKVKNIMLSYLSEKGYINKFNRLKAQGKMR